MSEAREVSFKETQYGFRWGAMEVTRAADAWGTCVLEIKAGTNRLSVYASPTGRSLRVFSRGGPEWKPVSSDG